MFQTPYPHLNLTKDSILPKFATSAFCEPSRRVASAARRSAVFHSAVAAALLLPTARAGQPAEVPAAPPESPWTFATSIGAKTGYDSNVLLQDFGDQAKREAWVNSLSATFAATYQTSPLFKAVFSYAPEGVVYEGNSDENHITHRGAINLSGKSGDTSWEFLNGVTRIDGDDLGPRFTLNGGTSAAQIPAIGGVPLRDRRDATIFKNSFKLTQTFGQAFVRPVVSYYHHNFMTEQHIATGDFLGYENYIDRQEVSGGFDLGYEAWTGAWLVAGFRAGHQEQSRNQYGVSCPYSNQYYRFLAGIEGSPTPWLKLNVLAGPDFRNFDHATPASFDADKVYAFIDASATITPTKQDSVTLGVRRFMQPSFTSLCLYEDIVYEATYRHQFDSRFTAGVGFKAYGGEFRPPVMRNDWIFTPSASLSYTHSANLSAELAYSYDWTQCDYNDGREFTRHLVWLGLKYAF